MHNCLICNEEMTQKIVEGVEIDLCPVGHGVWLDEGELYKLTGIHPNPGRQLVCPSCGYVMATKVYANTEVDICPACFGVWLDSGEMQRIADLNPETGTRNEMKALLINMHKKRRFSMDFSIDEDPKN